jgi:tRNA A-37 threonylcarbamoyl transferase component Bud32
VAATPGARPRRRGLDLRLRSTSPGLVQLPWLDPLGEWDPTEVPFRDIPVGTHRHLVRFVHVDGRLWALKEEPEEVAQIEYDALVAMERRDLPAVRAGGLVVPPGTGNAVLVTQYLAGSWQYRRLLMRIPIEQRKHRQRLLDGMATLLVDLHRNGVYWGDCSLGNTLFKRDGQTLQAYLVDAETSKAYPTLSDGQRRQDLDVLVENVAGGLADLAERLHQPMDVIMGLFEEAQGVAERYETVWAALHPDMRIRYEDRHAVHAQIQELNDLGFAVDEVQLLPTSGGDELQLKVAVAGRHFHADQLRELTGLDAGEGQAQLLLNDLRAYHAHLTETGEEMSEKVAARRWLIDAFDPGVAKVEESVGPVTNPVQAYCDLLEVRWLLSECAGHDVGDGPALEALARGTSPPESAAEMAVVEQPTEEFALSPDLLAEFDAEDEVGDDSP